MNFLVDIGFFHLTTFGVNRDDSLIGGVKSRLRRAAISRIAWRVVSVMDNEGRVEDGGLLRISTRSEAV